MTHASAGQLAFIVAGNPDQLTGGYLYDARIVGGLRQRGWSVEVIGLEGRFPDADRRAKTALDSALSQLQDDSLVVIDGLTLCALPGNAERHTRRLRLVALVHHPLADETGLSESARRRLLREEKRAIEAVSGVIVTSRFTARRLQTLNIHPAHTSVVEPGVDAGALSVGRNELACRLLCVASLVPRKGHDVLVDALASIRDLDWHCDCVGATDRDHDWAAAIAERIERADLDDRIHLHGALPAQALVHFYQHADLFVLASHYEGYGMVISEALSHGLPIVTTTGGALAQTLPDTAGRAVAPGDAQAFARALRALNADRSTCEQLRRGALAARDTLRSWDSAVGEFAASLDSDRNVTAPPSHAVFADGWLMLREPADHASRAHAPTEAAARWLDGHNGEARHIVDLGSGSGSNLRHLAPRLPGPQYWTLIDHDAGLLAQAARRCQNLADREGGRVHIHTRTANLAGPLGAQLGEVQLVSAAALFDLVTAAWVRRLVDVCAKRRAAVLFALNIDGRIEFECNDLLQTDTDDTFVFSQIAAHQQRDKGFGPALGPRAPAVIESALIDAGYRLCSATSVWTLDTSARPLVRALMTGWRDAAREQAPAARARIDAWAARRAHDVCSGHARLRLGHRDVFAAPS